MTSGLSRRWVGLAARLSLAAGSVLVTLALLEAGSFLGGRKPGPVFPLETNSAKGLGRYDHALFWSLAPDAVSSDGSVRTNSLGLRGPAVRPASPDLFRVLFLGESSTFGWDVPYESSYAALLQRLLAEDGRGREVEVINGGMPGYTLVQGYGLLLRLELRLDPDVVLVAFGFNDFLPVSYLDLRVPHGVEVTTGLDDWELFRQRRRWAARLSALLTDRSNFWRTLRSWRRADLTLDGRGLVQTDDKRPRVPKEVRLKMLELMLEHCRARGVKLVVVVPWYRELQAHAPLLRRFAAERNVAIVDLPERLRQVSTRNFLDMVHPNQAGHRLIAQEIHRELARLGW